MDIPTTIPQILHNYPSSYGDDAKKRKTDLKNVHNRKTDDQTKYDLTFRMVTKKTSRFRDRPNKYNLAVKNEKVKHLILSCHHVQSL